MQNRQTEASLARTSAGGRLTERQDILVASSSDPVTPKDLAGACDRIVAGLGAHWGQAVFSSTNRAYWQDTPRHRVFSQAVRILSRQNMGHAALVVLAARLLVGRWFATGPKTLYAASLSHNNDAAFATLDARLSTAGGPRIIPNRARFSTWQRMAALAKHNRLAFAVRSLERYGHEDLDVLSTQIFGAACGLLFLRDLEQTRPRLVGVANDHSPPTFALLAVAYARSIPRFYVQHAPVTQYFPHLNVELAILNDRRSASSYQRAAERVGAPWDESRCHILKHKYPAAMPTRAFCPPLSICIGLSMYPNLEVLADLVLQLRQSHAVGAITLRPHPRYPHSLEALAARLGTVIDPGTDNLDMLVARTDLFLVSNSGLGIDLLRRAAPSVFVDALDHQYTDYFGLAAEGLLPKLHPSEMVDPSVLADIFTVDWQRRARAAFLADGADEDLALARWMNERVAAPTLRAAS